MKMISMCMAVVLMGSGCASVINNRNMQRRALAIRPVEMPLGAWPAGVEVGVDLFSIGAAVENPGETAIAAALDFLMLVGVYYGGKEAGWWGGNSKAGSSSGSIGTGSSLRVDGDGNIINYQTDGGSSSQPWLQGSGGETTRF